MPLANPAAHRVRRGLRRAWSSEENAGNLERNVLWSDVGGSRLDWEIGKWKWQVLTVLCSNLAVSGRKKIG